MSQIQNPNPAAPAPNQPEPTPPRRAVITNLDTGKPVEPQGAPKPPPVPGLPEGFQSVEELAAAWKKVSTQKTAETPQKPLIPPINQENLPADWKGVTQADLNSAAQEFAASGKLADATYEAFKAKGVPKSVVDQFISVQSAAAGALQEQAAKNRESKVFALTGGKENYQKMVAWAKDNLSAQEIAAFDTMVSTQDDATAEFAVKMLYARSVADSEPANRIGGSASGNPGGITPFSSDAEAQAAFRDPRYDKDPAFRDLVQRRVALSN